MVLKKRLHSTNVGIEKALFSLNKVQENGKNYLSVVPMTQYSFTVFEHVPSLLKVALKGQAAPLTMRITYHDTEFYDSHAGDMNLYASTKH